MFDRETSKVLLTAANCCEAVYLPFDSAAFESWAAPFDEVAYFVEGNTEVMGVVQGTDVFLVYRGTGNLKDVMTDLNAVRIPMPFFGADCAAHKGFYLYEKAVSDWALEFVKKHSDKKLTVCGHSLGGSAAFLSALRIVSSKDFKRALWVVTFGAAPCMNQALCQVYDNLLTMCTMRFEHNTDMVPVAPKLLPWLRLPSDRIYMPFCKKTLWIEPSPWKYRGDRLLSLAPSLLKWKLPLAALGGVVSQYAEDHGMKQYIEHLNKSLI